MSRDFEELVEDISKEIADIVISKNRDYGNSFEELYNRFGMVAVLIRFHDKLKRLENLTKNGAQHVLDESLEDTLRDMCGYGLLALAVMRKGQLQDKGFLPLDLS